MRIRWKIYLVSLLCLLFTGFNRAQESQASFDLTNKRIIEITRKSITQEELLGHLEFLTSERLKGRPTRGFLQGITLETLMVTDYLKIKCTNWRLWPAGEEESPNQQIQSGYINDPIDSINVAFCIPGTVFPQRYIVLVAHYDHIGYGSGESGASLSPAEYKGKQIHPGADDNASGVSALLELAQTFSDLYNKDIKPKCSIIFLFAGAEEVGLRGSRRYATMFPFEAKVVTAISLDMIGRPRAPDSFELVACEFASEASQRIPGIFTYIQKWKDVFGFHEINYPPGEEKIFFRSDHYPFWENSPEDNRIPSILFMAGMDEEKGPYYHTIWDTLRDDGGNLNIDLDYLERFSEFVTILVWEIANGPIPDYVENLITSGEK